MIQIPSHFPEVCVPQVVVLPVALHFRTSLTCAVNTVAAPQRTVETQTRHPHVPNIMTQWPLPRLCHIPLSQGETGLKRRILLILAKVV